MATTPYMSLTLPDVSTTLGPTWATELNAAITGIDAHNHLSGSGQLIPTAALNINADLPINGFNLTTIKSVRLSSQVSPLGGASDIGCLYESGVDLYYNDGNGNQIQLTAGGALNAASVGGIGGDYSTSTASVFYTSASKTFTFWQNSNYPAILDFGSIVLRKVAASGNGITIQANSSIAAPYTLTLPAALPAALALVNVDATGALSFANTLTLGSTINLGTIDATNANKVIDAYTRSTGTTVGVRGVGVSGSSGTWSLNNSTTPTDITNLSVQITTSGRPVLLMLIPGATSATDAAIIPINSSGAGCLGILRCLRDGTNIGIVQFGYGVSMTGQVSVRFGYSAAMWLDTPAAGTYLYKIQGYMSQANVTWTLQVLQAKLMAFEL